MNEPPRQFPEEQRRLDERLHRLLRVVVCQAGSTQEQARALDRLLKVTPRLTGIRTSRHPDYLEALNETLRWLNSHIHEFRFEHAPADEIRIRFVNWVNGNLRHRINDLYRFNQKKPEHEVVLNLDRLPQEGLDALQLDTLELSIAKDQEKNIKTRGLLMELCIENDPNDRLKSRYCARCSACNCQVLAKKLLLRNQGGQITSREGGRDRIVERQERRFTVRALAREFGVNEQTVHTHWRNICLPLLQEIANNL